MDTSKPDWEEDNLKRVNVVKGLERKKAAGEISVNDFDAITAALQIPRNAPKGEIAKSYRNRLGSVRK